jgi:ADP-heptose:LPS heptosyltransferase
VALLARTAIGSKDIEWDNRIIKLKEKRIALYRLGAIGDVIMTLNLINRFKIKYPDYKIDYYCGEGIAKNLGYLMKQAGIDEVFGTSNIVSEYEKVFNLIGYPLDEGYPYAKMSKHLLEYFAKEVDVEINRFDIVQISLPERVVQGTYVTIHAIAGWSEYKNWPIKRWEQVVRAFPDIKFYQIGAALDAKISGVDHTFMGADLSISIALFANANLHLGIDSFTNHLTHFVWGTRRVPAIILWGSTQASAAGYEHNINITTNLECQPCFRENPNVSTARTDVCPNMPFHIHECMNQIYPELVIKTINEKWSKIHT